MDAGPLASVAEGSPEGETVCAALARYETTLRDAVREIHVDVSAFKLGIERRLEEAINVSGPLGRAVAQLQQENRQLRGQLEALTRQVEMLTGSVCDRSALLTEGSAPPQSNSSTVGHQSPPSAAPSVAALTGSASSPTATRFSSRATFSVTSKTNVKNSTVPLRRSSPPNGVSQEHSAPVSMAMPHLPITATTKVTDSAVMKSPESPGSPMQAMPSAITDSLTSSQPVTSDNQLQLESPVHAVYSEVFVEHSKLNVDMSGDLSFGRGIERRRELVRSQTLPRNIGAQARRSIFERLDSENNSRPKPVDSKPKLKRSQSFGVSSASSIKQILLEWCRSKTIGYQNIDIQNFSSSWSDGMAFCALVHSFFPTEFDYNVLSPVDRKHNFELAFSTAEKKAGCDRLIEVEDMMVMGRKPDPMCVFTYVQSLYNHLRKFE
ncbi:smoothelin-like protein 2 [Sinocyclocheilus rhinocerous]|uniref:smoothelin-like protein 2 n=1 Tax=Sinocyclocheilus rhinocerous TaxID=307959 RepID=UPI0007B8FAAF|nr:PREDICTED: smoothelin-like protein 2 [Sinocyclocheilus rhinocerous]